MEDLKFKVAIETDRISPEKLIDPGAIGALVEINDQIEKYKNELKELAEVEKEQGRLSEDQKRQQEETRLALKDAQNEYRNLQKSIKTVDEAVQSSITTYDGLVKENKALMEAMRQLPLDDTTGELQRLQVQYNANNEELKKFDAVLGNHQRNVGNYKSGLGGVVDSLSSMPGPIGGVVTSVKTLNATLKANPIGLVIAALAGLIAMFSKFQPVVDFATKSFQVLTNTLQFFVEKAGGFLGLIEESNITLADTIRKTAELADAEVGLRDAKR
jgi:small-conductance mechanosensitive channel